MKSHSNSAFLPKFSTKRLVVWKLCRRSWRLNRPDHFGNPVSCFIFRLPIPHGPMYTWGVRKAKRQYDLWRLILYMLVSKRNDACELSFPQALTWMECSTQLSMVIWTKAARQVVLGQPVLCPFQRPSHHFAWRRQCLPFPSLALGWKFRLCHQLGSNFAL